MNIEHNKLKKLSKKELMFLILQQEAELKKFPNNKESTALDEFIKEENNKSQKLSILLRVVSIVIVVAAITVLIATLVTPVMKVHGTSMEPILRNGDLLLAFKGESFIKRGDIIAFYYNDKVLLKRAIGFEGDKIDIDKEGNIFVNDIMLDEPYVSSKSFDECDVKFPLIVSANSVFVLGDHRSASVDSRSSEIGNVKTERIVGKVVLRIWPFDELGGVSHLTLNDL